MDEQILKPLYEASYLIAINAWRYRAILRYFYQQHERMRHYMVLEEIYQYLKGSSHFRDYSEEQLQQDLDQLVAWKNLVPRQDTGRVSSIEEFKKRKFRYQLTPYTVAIERMVLGLENLGDGSGGSLERTLFDRLLLNLMKLTARTSPADPESDYAVFSLNGEDLNLLWQDIYGDFRKLTENATDYLAHLQSEKVEEKMLTEAFLVYKEALTEYLRNFVTSLQRTSFRIEGLLQETTPELVWRLADVLADYELSIPRLDERPAKEQIVNNYLEQWQVLQSWFLGDDLRESDLLYLQNATNETIRRLTRFAQRLGESRHNLRSRRTDYLHLAQWFAGLDSLEEAHRLSACVFGVFHTRHFLVEEPKQTERSDVEVWDEPSAVLTIRPRVRSYHEKVKPNAVVDRSRQKQAAMAAYLSQKASEQQVVENLIRQERIAVGELPEISPFIRKTLLTWIGKSIGCPDRRAKTDSGRVFKLRLLSNRRVLLRCEDGVLEMPDYILEFEPSGR